MFALRDLELAIYDLAERFNGDHVPVAFRIFNTANRKRRPTFVE